jgi:hypothetical protein
VPGAAHELILITAPRLTHAHASPSNLHPWTAARPGVAARTVDQPHKNSRFELNRIGIDTIIR